MRGGTGMKKQYPLFSNGTEFMLWQSRNCDRCVKAVHVSPDTWKLPKYRCAIQNHIELAAVTDGMGNKRDYEATHSYTCPHLQTERKAYKKKFNNHLNFDFDDETD